MLRARHTVSLLAAALICAGGSSARAEDPMAAAGAFRRGSQLLIEGNLAEACAAFEQSLRLDPQLGTRFNVARCHEEQGRLASAWFAYRELAQIDGNPARRDEAARRAQDLEPRLTRLVVTAVEAAPGLAVTRNGVDATGGLGVEVPVDAGAYEIVATAPGLVRWATVVTATGEGTTVTVSIPGLDRIPEVVEPEPPSRSTPRPLPRAPDARETSSVSKFGTRRIVALSLGATGAVVAGVGLAFGARASSRWDAAKAECGMACPDEPSWRRARQLTDEARTAGSISTILIGIGAASVIAGGVVWLTAPDEAARAITVAPVVAPDQVILTGSGRF